MASFRITVTLARGCDSSQAIQNPSDGHIVSDFPSEGYWTGPLPDIVLAPQSIVQVWMRRNGNAGNALTLGPSVVTVTPNLPAGQASLVEVAPLWLPLPAPPPEGVTP